MKLSLIIPALREEQLIASTLQTVASYLKQHDMLDSTEVIVVAADGGDKTAEIAKANATIFKHFRLITPGKPVGKGRDVKLGMQQAVGDYWVFTDADLATPIKHLEEMLQRLEGGADLVIGVRDIKSMHEGLARSLSSRFSNMLIRVMAVAGISDTQCGFKGFTKEVGEQLFDLQTTKGWGFDIELLAIAQRRKYKIVPQKIDDWSDPKGDQGLSGDSQLGAMIRTLRELVQIRINIWRGIYK